MTPGDDVERLLRLVGLRVRMERTHRGWTRAGLAARADVSRNFVRQLEQGSLGADLIRLWRVADALGVPIGELFADD